MISRFDDKLPEERQPEYEELTEMLRQAYHTPVRVPPERQAQALARARERLGFTESERTNMPPALPESPSMDATQPDSPGMNDWPEPRQHGFTRLISLIAATLVVGALIASSLLVFQVRQPTTVATGPTAVATGPTAVTTTPTAVATSEVRTQSADAVLQVSPGPYFVGEEVEVQLTLTSYLTTPGYNVKSGYDAKDCAPDLANNLAVVMTGNPTLADTGLRHALAAFDCSDVAQEYGTLEPGYGFTLRVYTTTVLTYSGLVTLATPLSFIRMDTSKYDQLLDGQTPSIKINVQSRVPAGHLITGQQHGTQVTINAPPAARSQLTYTYKTTCPGNPSWQWEVIRQPLLPLQQPDCINNPGAKVTEWAYVVGAPGYSVFVGSVKG